MIATAVVGLSFLICCSTIVFDQVAIRKAKERAVAMDFLMHYAENVKALPFQAVMANMPINSLYNGAGGGPRIQLPADESWIPVDTSDFFTFHPDLLWFSGRNPKMQVILSRNLAGGLLHDVEVKMTVAWDPPLKRGGRETVQIDMLRTKDL